MARPTPAQRLPRLVIRVPPAMLARLQFVRLLDGRSVTEWARATLAEAVGRMLVERPGWAWARAGAPWWADPRGGPLGAPLGTTAGGERVSVLDLVPEAFDVDLDREGDGLGMLVDLLPAPDGPAGRVARRVLLRAVDVLPWRKRRREPIPDGSPGAERAEREARRTDATWRNGGGLGAPRSAGLDAGSAGV